MEISNNTVDRICKILGYLEDLSKIGVEFVSSKELADTIAATDDTVRKDMSLIGVAGYTRKGYSVSSLRNDLIQAFRLNQKRRACVVGLGRLGTAILDYQKNQDGEFDIVAGFDCSINKLERIKTSVGVFPMNEAGLVIARESIELGIVAVPSRAAQGVTNQLIHAGIRALLNFSSAKIIVPKEIIYFDMDFTSALRVIAAKLTMSEKRF